MTVSVMDEAVRILMGHGCFKAYLFEIQRNASPICAHCRVTADTAMHMLLFCPSWAAERTSLFEGLGHDVLDRTYGIVRIVMCSAAYWTALADFCDAVMRKTEQAEWEHQALKKQRAFLDRAY
ncbi:PREDICTED: uncharacterized protein LOC105147651 [Acromyrmex echinatior]|uniref:uncharacterized protein LOC105147651 n=1 Tax=Acromyrmex echinatior TaxID=103372 RepID=UPI000580C38F|nr:PREDICTED: uncharacterized protein LOC105147651 [Acromyrmex echinatior]